MKVNLVAGIGVYEKGIYLSKIGGTHTKEYQLWYSMLQRCKPNGLIQRKNPSYIGCSVHPDFIHFQDFAQWCQTQIGFGNDGWDLEKDILVKGNKVYGPDTCVFVPIAMNQLLTYTKSNIGLYPIGVCKHRERFIARIHIAPTHKYLGTFDTPEQAYAAYKIAKLDEIYRQADLWKDLMDVRVYNSLVNWTI